MRPQDIDAAVAAEAAWMEGLLIDLVEARTVLGQEEVGQALMAAAFSDCGLEPVDVPMDADAIRADPRHSPFSWTVAGKRNVTATWRAERGRNPPGRSLVLNGHIDVVPPASEELWAFGPFTARREGDWLYGRGAADMKAGLVAMTGAVRALRRRGVRLRGDVHLQSVVEEECTGNGTLQCLLAGAGARADAAILTEPHPDHVTVAQVGVLWFHVVVRGMPAHAGRASALGHNALEAALSVLAALRGLESELNAERTAHSRYRDLPHPINLNPGIVSAGDWASTVPAQCTLSCRLALYPGIDPADFRARVEQAVADAAAADPFLAAYPPTVSYDGFSCEGCEVDEHGDVVLALGDAYEAVHGERPPAQAITSTTDARHFVGRAVPALCYGPRGENMHGIDERVSLASTMEVARVLSRFILAWCGEAWN
jgi:acetylornithine deacetylase